MAASRPRRIVKAAQSTDSIRELDARAHEYQTASISHMTVRCSGLLILTKRDVGRVTAPQIALYSFWRLTWGAYIDQRRNSHIMAELPDRSQLVHVC